MSDEPDVLERPEFWAMYLASSFGQVGEPFDSDVVFSSFGLTEDAALKWWNGFTGWYDGVLDDSDGVVEKPSIIHLPLGGNVSLELEIHAGLMNYFIVSDTPRAR